MKCFLWRFLFLKMILIIQVIHRIIKGLINSIEYLKKLIPKLEKRREELSNIKEKNTAEYDRKITCAKDTFAVSNDLGTHTSYKK